MSELTPSVKKFETESDAEHLKKFEGIYSDNIKY